MNTQRLPLNHNHSVWGLPGTIIWGLLIIFTFVVTQVVVMGVYIGMNYGDVASSEYENLMMEIQYNGIVLSVSMFATLLVCGLLIVGVIKLKKNSNLKHYLGLKTVDPGTFKYWLVVIICLIVASDLFTLLLGKPIVPEFIIEVYKYTDSKWMLWLAFILAAPLFEELFFRGFLFSGFSSSIIGPVGAIVITAALWAVIHLQYDLYGLITIFILGVVLGIARYKSGSVLLTIGLHSFTNLVATIEAAIYIS